MRRTIIYLADKGINVLIALIVLPSLAPTFGPLLPNITEAIQNNLLQLNQSFTNRIVRHVAAGYGEASYAIISLIIGIFCICGLIGISLLMRYEKERLLKQGKSMSLSLKIVSFTSAAVVSIIVGISGIEYNERLIAMNWTKSIERRYNHCSSYYTSRRAGTTITIGFNVEYEKHERLREPNKSYC